MFSQHLAHINFDFNLSIFIIFNLLIILYLKERLKVFILLKSSGVVLTSERHESSHRLHSIHVWHCCDDISWGLNWKHKILCTVHHQCCRIFICFFRWRAFQYWLDMATENAFFLWVLEVFRWLQAWLHIRNVLCLLSRTGLYGSEMVIHVRARNSRS